jgi:hypothetical protein
MPRALWLILILALGLCRPSALPAWNDAGHMTVSRIAWDSLTADERAVVIGILKQHPHLDSLLRNDRPERASDEEWIFLKASVWADYVRPPKSVSRDDVPNHPLYKFHKGNWHYVNFPYRTGQASTAMPEKSLPDETNILKQLDQTMKILAGGKQHDQGRLAGVTDEQNRAVRLTWLFHLVGDLHQPMHTVALVDPQLFIDLPHTDLGGNKLAIRADAGSMPKNLHWFWDEMFSTDSHFDQVCSQAERLTHDPSLRTDQLSELKQHTTFREWAAESYASAVTYAYQNDQLKLVLWENVNSGRVPQSEVPMLPPDALKMARLQAERRITLAGYRLAAKLKEIARK